MPIMTATVLIDDTQTLSVSAELLPDEQGIDQTVLMFDAAFSVMEAWRQADPDHRKFGWTSDADTTDPEDAFLVWIDPEGRLQLEYAETFYDGEQIHNGYEIDELTAVDGISVAK